MKGSELKIFIKNSGVKLTEIVDKSGIPQRTLYNLYEKGEIEQHYIDDLAKALPKLHKIAKVVEDNNPVGKPEDIVLLTHKLLNRLDKSMAFHEKHITDLEINNRAHIEANKAFIGNNQAFVESSKVLTKIVDMCLQAGALTVDKSKIVDLLSKVT